MSWDAVECTSVSQHLSLKTVAWNTGHLVEEMYSLDTCPLHETLSVALGMAESEKLGMVVFDEN